MPQRNHRHRHRQLQQQYQAARQSYSSPVKKILARNLAGSSSSVARSIELGQLNHQRHSHGTRMSTSSPKTKSNSIYLHRSEVLQCLFGRELGGCIQKAKAVKAANLLFAIDTIKLRWWVEFLVVGTVTAFTTTSTSVCEGVTKPMRSRLQH